MAGYNGFDSEDDFNLDGLEINSGAETGFEAVENDDGQENTAETSSGKSATRKTSLTAIICGVGVIVLAVVVVGIFSKLSDKKVEANNNKTTVDEQANRVEDVAQPPQKVDLGGKNTSTSQSDNRQNTVSETKPESNNGWIEFSTDDSITFKDEKVALTFTITKVTNYVKIVDSNSNLMVKSVLTGALSGLSGTYEIEVPYSIAGKVNPGDFFDVTVEIGTDTRGKTVVGEILY